jgi:hypothetical protein
MERPSPPPVRAPTFIAAHAASAVTDICSPHLLLCFSLASLCRWRWRWCPAPAPFPVRSCAPVCHQSFRFSRTIAMPLQFQTTAPVMWLFGIAEPTAAQQARRTSCWATAEGAAVAVFPFCTDCRRPGVHGLDKFRLLQHGKGYHSCSISRDRGGTKLCNQATRP